MARGISSTIRLPGLAAKGTTFSLPGIAVPCPVWVGSSNDPSRSKITLAEVYWPSQRRHRKSGSARTMLHVASERRPPGLVAKRMPPKRTGMQCTQEIWMSRSLGNGRSAAANGTSGSWLHPPGTAYPRPGDKHGYTTFASPAGILVTCSPHRHTDSIRPRAPRTQNHLGGSSVATHPGTTDHRSSTPFLIPQNPAPPDPRKEFEFSRNGCSL